MTNTSTPDLRTALKLAEAALSDIGDADHEPGDDLAWCEARAAKALPAIRAALAAPAQQVAPDGGSIVRLVEEKIAAMSPSEVAAFMTARAALAAPKAEPAAPDITDAGIAIWKKRALEAEALNHRFITDINGPTFVGEPTTSDDAFIAREFYESQDDSLLLCASDLQHSAIYDNHVEMQSCMRAVADRITALASVIDGVERADLAAPAQAVPEIDIYVWPVPDKCDRIVWRGAYHHLPIQKAAQLPPARRRRQVASQ